MGYMAHHALLIYIHGFAWVKEGEHKYSSTDYGVTPESFDVWRRSIPPAFRRLVIGPIPTAANGEYVMIAMLPDGSKEGWGTSDTGDEVRQALVDMFSFHYDDGSSPFQMLEVRFGGDEPDMGYAHDPRDPSRRVKYTPPNREAYIDAEVVEDTQAIEGGAV